jgi:hypothetical protein
MHPTRPEFFENVPRRDLLILNSADPGNADGEARAPTPAGPTSGAGGQFLAPQSSAPCTRPTLRTRPLAPPHGLLVERRAPGLGPAPLRAGPATCGIVGARSQHSSLGALRATDPDGVAELFVECSRPAARRSWILRGVSSWLYKPASRRRRGPVALRPRFSPGVP